MTEPTSRVASMSNQPGTDTGAVDTLPVLEMVGPMLGFPEHRRFALTRLDDEGTVCDLRSLDDPELRFVVVPPSVFFADYTPEITDATADLLRADSADQLVALSVVTLGDDAGAATANLLAPVLVNHARRIAAQVVLDDASLPLRAPLVTSGPSGN